MIDELTVDALNDPEGRATLAAAAALRPTAVDAATGALWVFRYEEIDRLAHDANMIGVGLTWFDVMGVEGDLRRWYGSLMFTNEGDTHSRLRRLVSRAFTPRSAERLREHTADVVYERFDLLDTTGGGDLTEVFGRVAMRVMCRLLGVPEEDVNVFGAWADALSPVFGFMDAEQIAAAQSALTDLLEYVAALVEKRRSDPRDDLMTALLQAEEDGDRLRRDEVVTMVANLLVGGHDTTTSQIGCTLLTLMRHADAVARLRSGNAEIGAAVSETMRYEPSIGIIPRTVAAPVEIGGMTRPAGTMVLLSVLMGNRDPAAWDRPDTFDVDRFTRPDAPGCSRSAPARTTASAPALPA
jgi:cytochrome P450